MGTRKTLKIGTTDRGTAFSLPNELASRRTSVFGISGSGKSNTATVCIEGLLTNGEQVVLIDPKGEGWGLRSSADGLSVGHDVIVFGESAQPMSDALPLRVEHAEVIADFVMKSRRSAVLSLLGFNSDAEQGRFITSFLERLYRIKSRQAVKTRTLVVLEEAHLVAPQISGTGQGPLAKIVASVRRIARQGRSAGLGLMVVDQRPADVAKSVITQSELLICHQIVHPIDMKALREWVKSYDTKGQSDEFFHSIASLQPGEAIVWSPGWLGTFERVKVDRRSTFDSGGTPDGDGAKPPQAWADIDREALEAELASVVEEKEANDPGKLKGRINQLEREVERSKFHPPGPTPEEVQQSIDTAIKVRDRWWVDQIKGTLLQQAGDIVRSGTDIINKADKTAVDTSSKPTPVKTLPQTPRPTKQVTTRKHDDDDGLSKPHHKILDALAWWESLGISPVDNTRLGVIAKLKAGSGHFNNCVGRLSSRGYVLRETGTMQLTDKGREHANLPDSPLSLSVYHESFRSFLRGRTIDVFDLLRRMGPGAYLLGDIAEELELKHGSGHFNNILGPLGTLGLTRRARGQIVTTDLMFPQELLA